MADAGNSSRPLSPHLTIYRPQMNSVLSILHRIAGVGLSVILMLLVWWFLAAAGPPGAFALVDGLLTSWFGSALLVLSLWAFWYHFFNGVRHLRWDLVKGLGIGESLRTGWYVLVLSVLFTAYSIYLAL